MRRTASLRQVKAVGAGSPPYRFSQGTPLGALSAWPAFAVTHHVLVQVAAKQAGVKGWFSNYAIVGDDLVLGDFSVAREYLSILDFFLVKVSSEKSIRSENGRIPFAIPVDWS